MKQYITFGGAPYDKTIELIVRNAPRFGADDVRVYDDRFILDHDFYLINHRWWFRPDTKYGNPNRGFGWFIWKPFVILHALDRLVPGDLLIYSDGDCYPIANLAPVYVLAAADGAAFFAENGCEHKNWCKRDTFVVMAQDEPAARPMWHASARTIAIQAGNWRAKQLLIEWLAYCLNPLANTFDPSVLAEESPDLHEPRCEQAILTNLVHKYQFPLHREPGSEPIEDTEENRLLYWRLPGVQDRYPRMFEHVDNATDRADKSGSKYRNVPAVWIP